MIIQGWKIVNTDVIWKCLVCELYIDQNMGIHINGQTDIKQYAQGFNDKEISATYIITTGKQVFWGFSASPV